MVAPTRIPPGYRQEPLAPGRPFDSKIYIGFVKNNADDQRMGRLQVWIPEIGGDPDDSAHWFTVSYASPFAGATNWDTNSNNLPRGGSAQQSYGFWFVPPDLNNEVLVTFIGGEPSKGIWFACLYQQYMNHMVPGVPVNRTPEKNGGAECGSFPPVIEYNRWDETLEPPDPVRGRFTPLADGLCKQGLMSDEVRGPSSSGARREAPSRVFGIKTPRGQHLVMDDDPASEFIRIRTRSGAQVLVSETTGFVYINSKNGNSWVEISDSGIDVYSLGSISMRAEQDINLRADNDINIDAGQMLNLRCADDLHIQGGNDANIVATKGIYLEALGEVNLKAKLDIALSSTLSVFAKAGVNYTVQAGVLCSRRAPQIWDNGAAPPAFPASGAGTKLPRALPDTDHSDPENCCNKPTTKKTIVARLPAHEPWKLHPTEDNLKPPRGGGLNLRRGALTDRPSPFKMQEGEGTFDAGSQRRQKTGSGESKLVPVDPNSAPTVNYGNRKVREDVLAGIREASDISGIPVGTLMAEADIESSLNPNAKAGTSSASGLFQFTDSTWNQMVSKYGNQYGISAADKNDPRASAIMGALYMKENDNYLSDRIGRDPNPTDLYVAHFLGGGGASKFLNADPDAPAISAVSASAASANRTIFYNADGSPRSVQQVYTSFSNKMEPKAKGFETAFGEAATTTVAAT